MPRSEGSPLISGCFVRYQIAQAAAELPTQWREGRSAVACMSSDHHSSDGEGPLEISPHPSFLRPQLAAWALCPLILGLCPGGGHEQGIPLCPICTLLNSSSLA
jgi:hypothetical protein